MTLITSFLNTLHDYFDAEDDKLILELPYCSEIHSYYIEDIDLQYPKETAVWILKDIESAKT